MKTEKQAELKRASITVEACFIIPFLTAIIFVLFCLCLYLHDRSMLAASAAELAGKGAGKKYQTEKELEEWLNGQALGLAEGRLLAVRELEATVRVTRTEVTVTYTGSTPLLGGLNVREQETAKRLNPVEFIRGRKRLKAIFQEGKEKRCANGDKL